MHSVSFKALAMLRGAEGNVEIAARAHGPDTAPKTIKSTANYFSRVINGRVPKVSGRLLELLALGLGYDSMSAFFYDWERVTEGELPIRRPQPGHPAKNLADDVTEPFEKFTQFGSSPYPTLLKSAITVDARKRSQLGRSDAEHADATPNTPETSEVEDARLARLLQTLADAASELSAEVRTRAATPRPSAGRQSRSGLAQDASRHDSKRLARRSTNRRRSTAHK